MLHSLSISNYALIDSLELDWEQGLTTLTGETGSGKSILLGALSLVLGKRADTSVLRDPGKKCIIEASFKIGHLPLQSLFEENDWDWEDISQLRREILPSGKSRAFINDTPAPIQQIQQLSVHLIDIHSQHQSLDLFSKDYQRQVLDVFAGNLPTLTAYQAEYRKFKALQKELEEKRLQRQEKIQEEDYKSFLLKELEEADLDQADPSAWEEEYELLSSQERISEILSGLQQLLQHEGSGVLDQMAQYKGALHSLTSLGKRFEELAQRFESSYIELDDLAVEAENQLNQLEGDPGRQQWLSERLQLLLDLQRKHLVDDVAALVEKRDALATELDDTAHLDQRIEALEGLIEEAKTRLENLATQLTEQRQAVVPQLKQKLSEDLSLLGMPSAQFKVEFHASDDFLAGGKEEIEWLFSANVGGDFGSLKKVASGGELSRIMLVVKALLAEHQQLPTLIFDEIDTGVSGEIADQMGRIMKTMSRFMQIIVITHLPQVAAKGQQHLKVYKRESGGETFTGVEVLGREERLQELASMISGKDRSETALRHAEELLTTQDSVDR